MKYQIIAVPSFLRAIKKLAKHYRSLPEDYENLLSDLKANPQLGIDLGGGLRKVRMRISDKNKGKSGGARIITFTFIISVDEAHLHLVCIYDKSERENMTLDEIRAIIAESGLAAE